MPRRRAHHETAAAHLTPRVPVAHPGEDCASVRSGLAGKRLDTAEIVCVVGEGMKLLGVAPLVDVLTAPPSTPVEALIRFDWPVVALGDDQETVAAKAFHAAVSCVPVIEYGKLVGAVPPAALLAIARHEHVDDIHRLAGIRREARQVRGDLHGPPMRRARHRLPWLMLGLLGSLGAAAVVSGFVDVLERNVALSFFVPMIVYLADAIGTQTEAIVVRGLSLSRVSLRQILVGELVTGALIGTTLAALALPAVALLFGDLRVAVAVAVAIAAAGTVATTIGLLLPWTLHRFGSDPALGSGPVATIIQDVLSILIYFAVAIAIIE